MILLLSTVGVLAVGSAQQSVQQKQLLGVIMGTFLMVVISLLDYTVLLKLYWLMYLGNLVLLLLVRYLGYETKGAQRWFQIPGGFRFQPSETAKILLILFFAQFIMKYIEKLNTFRIIALCVALMAAPWYLIYKQPDLSTSIVMLALFCIIMFAGGLSFKVIFGVVAVAVPALALLVALALQPDSTVLTNNQRGRILAFIYPEQYATTTAYQQLNSVTAIASGMLDGKGYKNNEITSVKNGNFISEAQTDFIFAVIGEEFGFKGSLVVILLETGLRISELCGLTLTDLNFEKRFVNVDHQLLRSTEDGYYIEAPKTESGFRQVPMSAAAYEAFERVLKKRRDGRCIEVDGYKDFLFLNRDGLPKTAVNYDAMFKCLAKKYNKCHKEPLPDVMTPHTMRHTFCTRMANAGMNPKALQYIMGHANIVMTLNYYAHATFHSAQEEMERLQAKAKTTAEAKPEPAAESAEETKAA